MKQTEESQQLLKQVKDVVEMPQNNDLSLDIASRICNSYLLSLTDQLISFAFHESTTVIEASKEAKKLNKLVTVLYLDWETVWMEIYNTQYTSNEQWNVNMLRTYHNIVNYSEYKNFFWYAISGDINKRSIGATYESV